MIDLKYEKIEKYSIGTAAILICVTFGGVALYLLFKFGFSIFLPFLIGWAVALMIAPLARKLAGKNERKQKAVSVIFFVILIILLVWILSLAFSRLIYEAQKLMERLSDDSARVYELIGIALDFAQSITEHIPFLDDLTMKEGMQGLRDSIDSLVGNIISDIVTRLSSSVPVWLGNLVSVFPSLILFIVVTLISGFYFCVDLSGIHSGIRSVLPKGISNYLGPLRKKLTGTALKYLRAYILLLLLTFGELFIGFSILGIDYALLLAALIALIDILPVFGVGGVLIPWSVVLLISKNYYIGFGLLIIYGCVTVVRQIVEPKIIGGSLGIHPLLTLISMYAGFKLFGFVGMIFGPLAALCIKSVIS